MNVAVLSLKGTEGGNINLDDSNSKFVEFSVIISKYVLSQIENTDHIWYNLKCEGKNY